jgi:hypothetical protein
MIHRITQNGKEVTEVQPGAPLRLGTGGTGWNLNVRFVVTDLHGNVFLNVVVGVNLAGNAYMDWFAPDNEGRYIFYGNYDDAKNDFRTFDVSSGAVAPTDDNSTTPGDTSTGDGQDASDTSNSGDSLKVFGLGMGTAAIIAVLLALLIGKGKLFK